MAKLQKSTSTASITPALAMKRKRHSTWLVKGTATSGACDDAKAKETYAVSRQQSCLFEDPESAGDAQQSKRGSRRVVDSPMSTSQEVELLLPAESAAGKNLQNPKARFLLGVKTVVRFEMVPDGKAVLLVT